MPRFRLKPVMLSVAAALALFLAASAIHLVLWSPPLPEGSDEAIDTRLRDLSLPTLVIHGELDPLIPVSHGRKLAETIPGARGVWLEGLGHDLKPQRASEVTGALLEHFEVDD